MPDTDYEDASLELPKPKAKRRGVTYGKRAARAATAAAGPANGRARSSTQEINTYKKRAWKPSEDVGDVGRDEPDDADSESAGEDNSAPPTKRARKSTSSTELHTSKTNTTTSAPLRHSLSNPSPIKLASSSQRDLPPPPNSKRTSSALSSRRECSKLLRASSLSSKKQPNEAKSSTFPLDPVAGEDSESEGEIRAKKKGRALVDVEMQLGNEDAPGLRPSATSNRGGKESITMEVDESAEASVVHLAPAPTLPSNSSESQQPSAPAVPPPDPAPVASPRRKAVLGDKSNLPRRTTSNLAPLPSINAAPLESGVASPRRHASLGGSGLVSRASMTGGITNLQVFQDPAPSIPGPSNASLRAGAAKRSQSASAAVAAASPKASIPPPRRSSATQAPKISSMDLASLYSALPEHAQSSSPILVPRLPLPLPTPVANLHPTSREGVVFLPKGEPKLVGLDDLELDPDEMEEVYRPPMPREGSVIPQRPGGMDSSMIIESYDDDGPAESELEEVQGDRSIDEPELELTGRAGIKSAEQRDVDANASDGAESSFGARDPDAAEAHDPEVFSPSQLDKALPRKLVIPPRHPRAPVDARARRGPPADEDDLAYAIRTTATGEDSSDLESEDDEAVLADNDRELGKAFAPGGRIAGPNVKVDWRSSRRTRFLRQVLEEPIICDEDASDDELLLA